MGKASRNRAKHQREREREQELSAARDRIPEILGLKRFEEYLELLRRHPSLLSDDAVKVAAELADAPAYGPLFGLVHRLLAAGRSDPEAAWAAFSSERDTIEVSGKELEAQQEQIDRAEANGEPGRALELIARAFPLAAEIGYGVSVCELLHQRGRLLCKLHGPQRADEIEEALHALEAALEVAVAGEQSARILMHRGLAYGERVKGDLRQNGEHAIASLRDALVQVGGSQNQELRAIVQTNLAVALTRSGVDPIADAREAVDMCRAALTYRSPERDAVNWAYTQINLAYALQTLAEGGEGDVSDARAAYEAVIHDAKRINDPALIGAAHHGSGRLELGSTRHSPEQMVEAHGAGQLGGLFENTPALESARGHLMAALELTPKDPDPIRYARILDDVSYALQELGDEHAALERARESLDLVTPTGAPIPCKNLAGRVGWILGGREDWLASAASYRTALAAAEVSINARLDRGGLADELRTLGNLHRWAAYALARSGDLQAAATAIDSGRARELQLRLGPSDDEQRQIEGIPHELRIEYEAALAVLSAAPIDATDLEASRRLGEAIAAIRDIPGLAEFRTGVSWSTIVEAVEPSWPLVYINPTPYGTLLLMLTQNRDGGVVPEAGFVATTSTEILMHMVVSGGEFEQEQPTKSYLIAASGQGDNQDVAGALDELLPWLSSTIGMPFVSLLRRDASAATLVPCGALEMAPFDALPVGPREEVVADRLKIRYAPSGAVCAAARSRACITAGTAPRFVAVADPDGSLPAAGPEVSEIADIFGEDNSVWARGSAATLAFLQRHASEASHLHFSCHARGGIFDAGEAAVGVAPQAVPATTLTTIGPLKTRLAVVSACQGAQTTLGGLVQAQFSVAAVLLAAGSACVIASLWSVDDLATALLMTRLYQELRGGDETPPGALRAAQFWLRGLSEKEERGFLERHPELAAEYARRVAEGRAPGRRDGQTSPEPSREQRPYAHPDYWAAFIAIGA